MPGGSTVVVVTDRFDPTADVVVEELHRRGTPLFRFDTSEFPTALSVSAELVGAEWCGELRGPRRHVDLQDVTGVYYRRPTSFSFPEAMTADERRWSGLQARLGFGGLLACFDTWLNHPHAIGYAEYKPVQLRSARQAGLRVPQTLLTNDPAVARRFVAGAGRTLYKPFGGVAAVTDVDGIHQLFATPIDADAAGSPSVAGTMHLFQQWVPKSHEVRLTVVDGRFFAARIDASSDAAHVDWRADYTALEYSIVDVPHRVRSAIERLMASLGLRFAAIDMVVTPDDEWWWLECNPNGQWAWIESETGLPIAAALVDVLEGRTDDAD